MRTTTGNSGLGCCVHRTALILIISLGFCYWPSRYIRGKHWSNHLRATKLWSRSHSCALFSSPMACSASCSFFRCNMFFMPSSCQHTTHSLCPAPVNRQHVLYALLLSTDSMFFMPCSCQQTACSLCPAPVNRQHVLYVQLLSTDSMFFMPCSCQQTCSLCPAPVNRHVLYVQLLSTDMFFMSSSCQQICSLCPAPVNRHVLYVQLLSTNMFFMQAPVNSCILYAQLLLTDTFFVYDPCQRTTHALCTAPINSQ